MPFSLSGRSGKKEALANAGGLLCCNDDALHEQLRNLTIVVEVGAASGPLPYIPSARALAVPVIATSMEAAWVQRPVRCLLQHSHVATQQFWHQ